MPTTLSDQQYGIETSVTVKAPVQAVAAANINVQTGGLAAFNSTAGSYTPNSGNDNGTPPDRILLPAQTDPTENGVWSPNSGGWTRTGDFDGNRDVVSGTLILYQSPLGPVFYQVQAPPPGKVVMIGTTLLTITPIAVFQTPYFPITAAEITAGANPVNLTIPVGDLRRYGAVLDGTTDDTVAVTNWAKLSGELVFPTWATARVTTTIPFQSNTYVRGGYGSVLKLDAVDVSLVSFAGKNRSKMENIALVQVSAGSAGAIGLVDLTEAFRVKIIDCQFTGWQWAGVFMGSGCQACHVIRGDFSNTQGTVQDSCDVALYSTNFDVFENWVVDCDMRGGGYHGILIQDPYSLNASACRRNTIRGNRIYQHLAYGIALYQPSVAARFSATISGTTMTSSLLTSGAIASGQVVQDATTGVIYARIVSGSGNTWTLDTAVTLGTLTLMYGAVINDTDNEILDNTVKDIQGNAPVGPGNSSGAGIYVTGFGIGGTKIHGNSCKNCNVLTAVRQQSPAAITVTFVQKGTTKPSIKNNVVDDCAQGDGILIIACPGGASLGGNTVNIPSTNNGLGAGGTALSGSCIRIEASSDIDIEPNTCDNAGIGRAMLIFANGTSCTGINMTGGKYTAVANAVDTAIQGGSFNIDGLVMGDVKAKSTGGGASQYALNISNVINARITGGSLMGAGSIAVNTSGTCTNSLLDDTVDWGQTGAARADSYMVNGGVGFTVKWRGAGAPNGGTWQVGDRKENTTPTVGGVERYVATTAGTGGGTAVFKTVSNT